MRDSSDRAACCSRLSGAAPLKKPGPRCPSAAGHRKGYSRSAGATFRSVFGKMKGVIPARGVQSAPRAGGKASHRDVVPHGGGRRFGLFLSSLQGSIDTLPQRSSVRRARQLQRERKNPVGRSDLGVSRPVELGRAAVSLGSACALPGSFRAARRQRGARSASRIPSSLSRIARFCSCSPWDAGAPPGALSAEPTSVGPNVITKEAIVLPAGVRANWSV